MGAMDHTLKQTVPYYSTMKRAGAFRQPQKPQKRQKRTTLTEYSQNGQKAILKPHVNNIEPPDDLEETAQELRDIADVLKITEGTDTNIRKSMESILRIAARLERKSNGKKRG